MCVGLEGVKAAVCQLEEGGRRLTEQELQLNQLSQSLKSFIQSFKIEGGCKKNWKQTFLFKYQRSCGRERDSWPIRRRSLNNRRRSYKTNRKSFRWKRSNDTRRKRRWSITNKSVINTVRFSCRNVTISLCVCVCVCRRTAGTRTSLSTCLQLLWCQPSVLRRVLISVNFHTD